MPVALAFAVLDRTRSITDLSIVLASDSVAQLIFQLGGGVIADRVCRRQLMLWSDVAQLLATGALGALLVLGDPPIAVIAAAGAVQGVASAIFLPAAAGIVPALVDAAHLRQANTLSQVTGAATRIAGPAIAGILVATVGPGWAIVGDSVSFIASVVSLAGIRIEPARRAARASWRTELRTGWAAFREHTWVWAITLGSLAANFAYAIFVVLGPVACLRYYNGAATWATISAAGASGSVIGGVATLRLRPRHLMRWALPAAACFGLTPLALSAGLFGAAVATLAIPGETGLLLFASLYLTTIQQVLPEQVISRVSSYDMLGSLAVFPLGLAVAGALAGGLGIRPVLILVGLVIMTSVLGLLVVPGVRDLTGARTSSSHPTSAPFLACAPD